MDLNRWIGVGRLFADPEMAGSSDSPTRIVSFIISNERGRKDKRHVNYFNCIAFTGLADLIYQYCKKGDLVGLDGEWKQKKFPDNKTGKTREEMKIVVYAIQFLSKKHSPERENQEDFENLNAY